MTIYGFAGQLMKPIRESKPLDIRDFKMQWLRQIHADETLGHTSFYACFYLCDQFLQNPNTYIEISREEIAKGGKISIRTVQILTKALAERGHIAFQYVPGKGKK